jgi:ribonuclease T2
MRAAVLAAFLGLAGLGPGARAEPAGFDYYLLALTWMPGWCLHEGDGRGDARCDEGAGTGWTLHGLWPQHELGWPEFCTSAARDPSRRETAAMADIMGSGGLAWHQWRKHGRCSGLAAGAYFALAREAFGRFDLPEIGVSRGRVPVASLAGALVAANPGLAADGFVASCPGGQLVELRICLTVDLEPRPCGADVLARACRGSPRVAPPR